MCKVDVLLVEDGGPLKGRAVEALAGRAMAILGGQGSLAAELVFDAAAMALAAPLYGEIILGPVDPVWGSMFPIVLSAVCGRARLVLVWFVVWLVSTVSAAVITFGFLAVIILVIAGARRHFERLEWLV